MPSFFTSSPLKKPTPVFAGLDDPFNFPTSKMRYTALYTQRPPSPNPSTDSGYSSAVSPDADHPLSPKSSTTKRRLRKDGTGHWRMHTYSYEYQSERNDRVGEKVPILRPTPVSAAGKGVVKTDNAHDWTPNLQHTFTLICGEEKRASGGEKHGWFATRVYGRKMVEREKREGVTALQVAMAPVLRRPWFPREEGGTTDVAPSQPSMRKKSTLLHPSRPRGMVACVNVDVDVSVVDRGRGRKQSTLLHPSSPPLPHSPSPCTRESPQCSHAERPLRSPRHRSPTPLRIPLSSAGQPAPTPASRRHRKPSVLHSCFSDEESDSDSDADADADAETVGSRESGRDRGDARSVFSVGEEGGVVVAETARVARAQRVSVRVGRREA